VPAGFPSAIRTGPCRWGARPGPARRPGPGRQGDEITTTTTRAGQHLWERNWSSAKRQKEQAKKAAQYAAKTTPLEKTQARELLGWTVGELQALPRRTQGEEDDLEEALEVQAGWNK
jgi:hypothetical protein